MKKIIIFMTFVTLIISSHSKDVSDSTDVFIQSIVLEENLQLIIPVVEDSSAKTTFVINLDELEKDIYPSENQIVLTNDKNQKLEIEKNLKWFTSEDQTYVNIDDSSKARLIEFLDKSAGVDIQIYKSNVMYTVRDIPIDYFKNLQFIN